MAGSAVTPVRSSHVLGDRGEVHRFERYIAEFFLHISGMTTVGGKFFVCSRGIVTDQAVYAGLGGQIKTAVAPTISRMAAGAPAPVGLWRYY